MAVLSSATTVSFGFLREHLDISDSDLSQQMSALWREPATSASPGPAGGRGGSTSYRLTRTGRTAYDGHRAALRAILDAG